MRFLRILLPALVLVALVGASPAQAIVAGSQVSITDYPYQARVVGNAPDGWFSCGGVVVDATHVVTAAHCAYVDGTLLAPAKLAVGYGSSSRLTLSRAEVAEVTIPSAYLNDASYDVALLTLASPLTFSASVKAIPLATAGTLATGVGSEATTYATGWGNIQEGVSDPDPVLRGVPLPLRADTICEAFPAYTAEFEGVRSVCAGGKSPGPDAPDTCQGDSGGPLALDSGAGYRLVGLTSTGLGCGRPFHPAIYTETSSPEIQAVIDGTAPPASTLRGSEWSPSSGGTGGAPSVTVPPSQAPAPPGPGVASRDLIRPTAKVSKLSCTKKRKCTFRVRAADTGGTVRKLAANVTRKVRTCRTRGESRVCSTKTRKKVLKPRRISGGFAITVTLSKATYRLNAVATDAAGNRSRALSKKFRVR